VNAVTQDGDRREGAAVVELHGLQLEGWPAGARVIARREPAHPGAQQGLLDVDGYRITCFLTDQPDTDIVELDRRHRAHARVEDRIRNAKATGLRNLPFADFRRNEVWVELVGVAQDLLAWTQLICLDGQLAKTEPKTLRYRLLHTAARIVCHARQVILRLQRGWPWTAQLVVAFVRARMLPGFC
jgi:Transposase DDE domain group 1